MTTQQLIVGAVLYSVALAAIVIFTRPPGRRLAGALAGATVVAGLGFWALIPLGEARGWWHVPLDPSPSFMALLHAVTIISTLMTGPDRAKRLLTDWTVVAASQPHLPKNP